MPRWQDFADKAPYAHLRSTLVFEVHPKGILVRFMGTELVGLWHKDFTDSYLDTFLDTPLHAKVCVDIRRVATYPVGLRISGNTQTSKGRWVDCESVTLPVAVKAGAFPRCVQFRHLGRELDFDELKTTFFWSDEPAWIDIGSGIPA